MASLVHGGRWVQLKLSTLERLRDAASCGDLGEVQDILDRVLDFGQQTEYNQLREAVYQRYRENGDELWFAECRGDLDSLIL